ncbi:MAG: hypothetical protein M0P39_12835 [Rhodocyclaceae bacterium]|jgi:hypothetical protein|nr:hypothetical protein [Rhodocyclaceae bacterium]
MLSMKECLDYCDLNEDEVSLIAHHEHLSFPMAAQMACGLVQSEEGTGLLRGMLSEAICEAASEGGDDALHRAERALVHFNSAHPPC